MPALLRDFDEYIGRKIVSTDDITAFPLAAMAATLNREESGDAVPPLWHWLYFLPVVPMAEVGPDGHPKRGTFLPPLPLPRRMWAGGRLAFRGSLKMGEQATRTSTIARISDKSGRSGRLVFVTVQHTIKVGDELRLEEEHDIVYRDVPQAGARPQQPLQALEGEQWTRTIDANAVLLMRYSALTFNGHRIHYDYPYATEVEGYPGLIVHGPLIATLLVDLVRRERPEATLQSFTFKALRPTFSGKPFVICGQPSASGNTVELWAKDYEGYLTMRATATLL